jgi:hypothetical protein
MSAHATGNNPPSSSSSSSSSSSTSELNGWPNKPDNEMTLDDWKAAAMHLRAAAPSAASVSRLDALQQQVEQLQQAQGQAHECA